MAKMRCIIIVYSVYKKVRCPYSEQQLKQGTRRARGQTSITRIQFNYNPHGYPWLWFWDSQLNYGLALIYRMLFPGGFCFCFSWSTSHFRVYGVYILYSILLHSSFCIGSAALFSRPRNQVQPTLPLRIPLSLGLLFGTDADSSSDTSLLGSTRGRGDLRCSFEK